MEPDRIRELLEKYWQAETNEAEEAELKEYFTGKPHLQDHPAAPLFNYFQEEQQVIMPEGSGEKFKSLVAKKMRPMRWQYPFLKVAAILLMVFSVVYVLLPYKKPTSVAVNARDTYDDPEKAYLQTKAALMLISRRLNAGESYINEIGKINKAQQLINSSNKR